MAFMNERFTRKAKRALITVLLDGVSVQVFLGPTPADAAGMFGVPERRNGIQLGTTHVNDRRICRRRSIRTLPQSAAPEETISN